MVRVELLECRQLMSVSATLTHAGTLILQGTSKDDSMFIFKNGEFIGWNDGLMYTDAVHIDPAEHGALFDAGEVKRIRVEGAGGDDYLSISPNLQRPCTIVGGAGNDSIFGGNFSETLSGGAGDDLIKGKQEYVNRKTAAIDAHIRDGRDFDALGAYDRVGMLVGGDGNDTIAPAANDHIDGGRGDDTITSELYTRDNTITVTKGSAESIFAPNTILVEHYARPERVFFY